MKKSELYYMAQIAVINAACIAPERKIEALKILIADEKLALFVEERDAEKAAANDIEED